MKRADPEVPCPRGYCEVWTAEYSSDREVDIMGEMLMCCIPGFHFYASYTDDPKKVIGYFCIPQGYTLEGATFSIEAPHA